MINAGRGIAVGVVACVVLCVDVSSGLAQGARNTQGIDCKPSMAGENCLRLVNQIRRERGLLPYRYSQRLAQDAFDNVCYRAGIGWHGRHLPGSRQVPPLSGVEGCEGPGYPIRSHEFYACTVSENRSYRQGYIYAGVAKLTYGGKTYCTIRLSRSP